eukprot:541278_1
MIDIGADVIGKNKRFCIFGYPGPDPKNKYPSVEADKLYGFAMRSDAEEKALDFRPCDASYDEFKSKTEYVLRQQEVDTSPGMSGAAVFVKTSDEVIICGVHIDGHVKKDDVKEDYSYNRVTLLSSNYIRIMRAVTESTYKENDIDIFSKRLELFTNVEFSYTTFNK